MNGRNTGTSARRRLFGASFGPVEQFGERRTEAMPHLFDRLDFQSEGVGQRLLGEPRIDSDAQRARRQLQQRNRPDASRWSSMRASVCGASSRVVDRRRSIASVMLTVASSTSGGSPCGLGHSSDTVSAMSPT